MKLCPTSSPDYGNIYASPGALARPRPVESGVFPTLYQNPDDEAEVPLSGGNISQPARVGHTVRRRAGPWTPAVHLLLKYLEATGFEGAPQALGIDAQGREVVTFFDGDVFAYPMPDFVWSEDTLTAVARLLREYHDIVRGFIPPPDALWRVMVGAPSSGPIICHNDIAPNNTVFRDCVNWLDDNWHTLRAALVDGA